MQISAKLAAVLVITFLGSSHLSYAATAKDTRLSTSKIAMDRKNRTEVILRLEGVPLNPFLPVIESENEVKLRSKEATAYRALALVIVASKAFGSKQIDVNALIKTYGVAPHLTPKERAYIENKSPTQKENAQFSWRIEAAWVLLWSLGLVEKLDKPIATCDVPFALNIMKSRSQKQFVAATNHRPLTQIIDESDKIYRYHWATVDSRINGRPSPAGLNEDVISERHWALNWLTGYQNQEWDDVTTDT